MLVTELCYLRKVGVLENLQGLILPGCTCFLGDGILYILQYTLSLHVISTIFNWNSVLHLKHHLVMASHLHIFWNKSNFVNRLNPKCLVKMWACSSTSTHIASWGYKSFRNPFRCYNLEKNMRDCMLITQCKLFSPPAVVMPGSWEELQSPIQHVYIQTYWIKLAF